jgi:hypothetical protein
MRPSRARDRRRSVAGQLDGGGVVSAWGHHLNSFRWAHFATLTPEFPDVAAAKLELHFRDHFVRNLARAAICPVPWFYAMERSEGGVLHMHALLANTEALTVAELRKCWKLGFTAVERYSCEGFAARYAAKTLHLPNGEWERWNVSTRIPPRLR